LRPRRLPKLGALVRQATLLKFHAALVEHKYRRLFSSSPSPRRWPGPKGPSADLIAAIIALQRRNPHFGCVRIAQQISQAFGVEIGKDVVRRALAGLTPAQRSFALRPAPAELDHYGWQRHCRGQFELPIAA
jgi:hypothetical protein